MCFNAICSSRCHKEAMVFIGWPNRRQAGIFKSQKYGKAFPSYQSNVSPLKHFFSSQIGLYFGSMSGNKLLFSTTFQSLQ